MRFGEHSTHEPDIAPEAYEARVDVGFTLLDAHAGPQAEAA